MYPTSADRQHHYASVCTQSGNTCGAEPAGKSFQGGKDANTACGTVRTGWCFEDTTCGADTGSKRFQDGMDANTVCGTDCTGCFEECTVNSDCGAESMCNTAAFVCVAACSYDATTVIHTSPCTCDSSVVCNVGKYCYDGACQVGPKAAVVNCVETTADASTCTSVDQELYTLTTPASGGGTACTGSSTVCVAGDIPATTCPISHPYAYHTNNAHCCKTNKEKVYAPQGTACDGSVLHAGGVLSMCCENDDAVSCTAPPCSNYLATGSSSSSSSSAAVPSTIGHAQHHQPLLGKCEQLCDPAEFKACVADSAFAKANANALAAEAGETAGETCCAQLGAQMAADCKASPAACAGHVYNDIDAKYKCGECLCA